MVLLVGERSRSLANLLAGLPIPASDATSTTVKKCLRTYNGLGYVYPAPAKSGVGISLPEITRAHNTRLACFFVPHSHILTMVGCMGAEQSAPGSLVTGKANPVQSATSKISLFSGGNIKPTREDAAMLATTPAQNPLFVWRFYSGQNSTYLTTTATSEREARLQLPAVRLVFVARIRQEGQRHA
ncbi:host cell division inhibitor Icd-like protein [Salmonella enterica]|nr:host cell division inhibitor Icd-like protein [Salmonella enterica]